MDTLLGKRTTAQVQPKPKQSLLEADENEQANKKVIDIDGGDDNS